MGPSTLGTGHDWLLVFALGIGTFGLRLSFIQLDAWLPSLPTRIERGLAFIPVAILSALVSSALFVSGGTIVWPLVDVRVVAAGLAAVTAWLTGRLVVPIGVGMCTLWALQSILG